MQKHFAIVVIFGLIAIGLLLTFTWSQRPPISGNLGAGTTLMAQGCGFQGSGSSRTCGGTCPASDETCVYQPASGNLPEKCYCKKN